MQDAPLQSFFSRNASLKSWETDIDSDGVDSAFDSESDTEEGRNQTEGHRPSGSICRSGEPRNAQADQIDTVYRLIRASPSVLRTKLTSRLQSET